jgi:hypothetical protein
MGDEDYCDKFDLALARRNRLKKRLAKIDKGLAPATPEKVSQLLSEIESLEAEMTEELRGGAPSGIVPR